MNDEITVLKIEPMKAPEVVTMKDDLASLQAAVGGYIEQFCPFSDEVAIICNEEGKLEGLELNRAIYDENSQNMIDIIAGPMLIVYAPYESENFQSLPPELIEKYKEKFKSPERFFKIGGEFVAVPVAERTREEAR